MKKYFNFAKIVSSRLNNFVANNCFFKFLFWIKWRMTLNKTHNVHLGLSKNFDFGGAKI